MMEQPNLAFVADIDNDAYCTLTPEECVRVMYEQTDPNGNLYLPAWPCDICFTSAVDYYALTMNWTEADCKTLNADYAALFESLKRIAAVYDQLGDTLEENRRVLSEDLVQVWDTYLRAFDTRGFDYDLIRDIEDRLDEIAYANSSDGGDVPSEKTTVTEEERALFGQYVAQIHNDAEKRLDRKTAAYDVIIRAMRLCKLLSVNAPEIVVSFEAKFLVQAMAVNRFAVRFESVVSSAPADRDR